MAMSHLLQSVRRHTLSDYLSLDNAAGPKHEFHDGLVVAMSGGSIKHAAILTNIPIAVAAALKGTSCRPYGSDLRIYVRSVNAVFYPDASIICGETESDAGLPGGEAATNPVVIFEVLSPSTEKLDRTRKFSAYMQLQSLREYVLVYSDQARIESFLRQDDGAWTFSFVESFDAMLRLRSLNVSLSTRDIFAGVTFDPIPEPPTLG